MRRKMKKIILSLFLFFALNTICFAEYLDRAAVWERTDGGISITYFDTRDMLPGESEDDFIERMSQKHGASMPGAVRSIIQKSDVPSDRSQRNEWALKNKKVEVDPVKVAAKQAQEAQKQAVFTKLGISEDEFKKLR